MHHFENMRNTPAHHSEGISRHTRAILLSQSQQQLRTFFCRIVWTFLIFICFGLLEWILVAWLLLVLIRNGKLVSTLFPFLREGGRKVSTNLIRLDNSFLLSYDGNELIACGKRTNCIWCVAAHRHHSATMHKFCLALAVGMWKCVWQQKHPPTTSIISRQTRRNGKRCAIFSH